MNKSAIATRKQFEYAKAISLALGVKLPSEFTVEEYNKFIKFYEKRYKEYLFEKNRYQYDEEDEEESSRLYSSRFYNDY